MWKPKKFFTEAEVEAAQTAKGGFSQISLKKLGVPWPPPKGWRRAITLQVQHMIRCVLSFGMLSHMAGMAKGAYILQRVTPARAARNDVRHVVGVRVSGKPRLLIKALVAFLALFLVSQPALKAKLLHGGPIKPDDASLSRLAGTLTAALCRGSRADHP
jgi:hypothetical protein